MDAKTMPGMEYANVHKCPTIGDKLKPVFTRHHVNYLCGLYGRNATSFGFVIPLLNNYW